MVRSGAPLVSTLDTFTPRCPAAERIARTGTATTTGGDLLIFASDANPANAAVSVTGGVIVDGDYIARGNSVALGAGAYQAADGLVAITAANGGITGGAGLRLISNADDGIAGGDSLLLSATGGDIDLAGTTLLGGLTNRTGRIGIYLGTAGSDVALGRVEARAINGTDIETTAQLVALISAGANSWQTEVIRDGRTIRSTLSLGR